MKARLSHSESLYWRASTRDAIEQPRRIEPRRTFESQTLESRFCESGDQTFAVRSRSRRLANLFAGLRRTKAKFLDVATLIFLIA